MFDVVNDAARVAQAAWRAHASRTHARRQAYLRSLCVCVVCHDECVHLVRCRNGHGCCVNCEMGLVDHVCPLCRETRPAVRDALTPLLVRGVRLSCAACAVSLAAERVEAHRAWCPRHRFLCPHEDCTECVQADGLAAHALSHPGVHSLARRSGSNAYEFCAIVTRSTTQQVLVTVESTLVVMQVSPGLGRFADTGGVLHVHLRAYYPSPDAPPLLLTLRQLAPADCARRDAGCTDELRCGVVAPMLASRETIMVLSLPSPAIVPRSTMSSTDEVLRTCLPNVGPSPSLAEYARAHGLRPAVLASRPLSPTPRTTVAVALVHVVLAPDRLRRIADVYRE